MITEGLKASVTVTQSSEGKPTSIKQTMHYKECAVWYGLPLGWERSVVSVVCHTVLCHQHWFISKVIKEPFD
jgi:hypothetical protein